LGVARRYPATFGAGTTALLLVGFFSVMRALSASSIPVYATSERQLLGIVLMLIVLPAYVCATSILSLRRALELVEQLREIAPSPAAIEAANETIRGAFRNSWKWGVLIGLVLAPFNTNLPQLIHSGSANSIDIGLSFGQYILWISVGLSSGIRVLTARAFSRLGHVVEIDLFDSTRLQPLARARMQDVLVIAVGLALTSLQSLDAEVRWENYRFAALVLLPSAALLLLWPLRSVHRRLREAKLEQLERVKALLRSEERASSAEEHVRLELLLAHRERIAAQSTWPLDTALLSRFGLYVIVPPLAWVGAAIVENIVDSIAAG
jgi:hypothetical protein